MIPRISSGGMGGKTLPQARRQLSEFAATVADPRLLSAALMVGGLRIQNRWKELIRERFFETGTYMRSVHMEDGEQRPGFAEVLLGTDIIDDPYPFYGEFGTAYMAARPTARPAMDEEADNAWDDFVDALDLVARRQLA